MGPLWLMIFQPQIRFSIDMHLYTWLFIPRFVKKTWSHPGWGHSNLHFVRTSSFVVFVTSSCSLTCMDWVWVFIIFTFISALSFEPFLIVVTLAFWEPCDSLLVAVLDNSNIVLMCVWFSNLSVRDQCVVNAFVCMYTLMVSCNLKSNPTKHFVWELIVCHRQWRLSIHHIIYPFIGSWDIWWV